MSPRVRAFVVIGVMGFAWQLAALSGLTRLGVPLALATALAVEVAVLHNFVWHEHWTWRDRRAASRWTGRLLRFHSSTAIISIAVNVLLTWLFARVGGLPPLAANALAVVSASLANFAAADRWVFRRHSTVAVGASIAALMVGVLHPASALAAPAPATLAAWHQYVQTVESREQTAAPACVPGGEPDGEAVRVPEGTIYRWSGCTLIRQVTVAELIDRLVASGTPPPQDDVIESRLLQRDADRLRVYLKLVRQAVVTVTYDTEHEMVFHRESATHANSRSVATRIQQADGGDHGFLWQLQSYWQYRQVGADVRVELVSLSLSRDVPMLARPVAGPLINRVARESMTRTLAALQEFAAHDERQVRARAVTPAVVR